MRPLVSRQQGFSLTELIAVTLIVAALAAIVTPKWLESEPSVEAVARQLQSDIRYVQGLAMTQGQRHRIDFNVASYSLADNVGGGVPHPLTQAALVTLPAGVTIVGNNFVSGFLSFDGRGAPYDGTTALAAPGTVQLGKGGTTRTVSVNAATGYVSVAVP